MKLTARGERLKRILTIVLYVLILGAALYVSTMPSQAWSSNPLPIM